MPAAVVEREPEPAPAAALLVRVQRQPVRHRQRRERRRGQQRLLPADERQPRAPALVGRLAFDLGIEWRSRRALTIVVNLWLRSAGLPSGGTAETALAKMQRSVYAARTTLERRLECKVDVPFYFHS